MKHYALVTRHDGKTTVFDADTADEAERQASVFAGTLKKIAEEKSLPPRKFLGPTWKCASLAECVQRMKREGFTPSEALESLVLMESGAEYDPRKVMVG